MYYIVAMLIINYIVATLMNNYIIAILVINYINATLIMNTYKPNAHDKLHSSHTHDKLQVKLSILRLICTINEELRGNLESGLGILRHKPVTPQYHPG